MSFQEEFDQRLRRVCGVTDDSMTVTYREDERREYSGYCSTCAFEEIIKFIEVTVWADNGRNVYATKRFDELGEMMRALDEVEL